MLHLGFRQGDGADMALIELVDFNEAALAGKKEEKKSTRRGRTKKADAAKAEAPAEAPVEAPAEAPAETPEQETPKAE